MKHTTVFAVVLLATGVVTVAAQPETPDRVDPPLDCSTPVLDADTPERAKLLLVQYGGDALARELRETYSAKLAGLFWDQHEGGESRLVVRLTGTEAVEDQRLNVCGEPLTVAFITGQIHTREELEKLHSDNLDWLRQAFPGLQGTYADERTGEIALDIYAPDAGGANIEAIKAEVESRLGAPLRIEMTNSKPVPAIPNLERSPR